MLMILPHESTYNLRSKLQNALLNLRYDYGYRCAAISSVKLYQHPRRNEFIYRFNFAIIEWQIPSIVTEASIYRAWMQVCCIMLYVSLTNLRIIAENSCFAYRAMGWNDANADRSFLLRKL